MLLTLKLFFGCMLVLPTTVSTPPPCYDCEPVPVMFPLAIRPIAPEMPIFESGVRAFSDASISSEYAERVYGTCFFARPALSSLQLSYWLFTFHAELLYVADPPASNQPMKLTATIVRL